jgi:hypothetical protein
MAEQFTIEKREGKPVIIGRPLFDQWFSKFSNGTRFSVRWTKQGNSRSNQQNAYYWAVIVKSYQMGAYEMWGEFRSLNMCHDDLKANCLTTEVYNEATGMVIKTVGSTTDNDTFEQEQYHERCRQLIYDYFGIHVPMPNEDIQLF